MVKPGGSCAVNLTGGIEAMHSNYSDFTDIRTGKLYSFDAGACAAGGVGHVLTRSG